MGAQRNDTQRKALVTSADPCRVIPAVVSYSPLAMNGATVHELNAVFGWTGSKRGLHCVALADRVRLAAGGAAKNKKLVSVVEAIEDFFD